MPDHCGDLTVLGKITLFGENGGKGSLLVSFNSMGERATTNLHGSFQIHREKVHFFFLPGVEEDPFSSNCMPKPCGQKTFQNFEEIIGYPLDGLFSALFIQNSCQITVGI
jgi:hypothetical protein